MKRLEDLLYIFCDCFGKTNKDGDAEQGYEMCFPLLGKFQVIFNSRKKTQNKTKENTHLVFFIKIIEFGRKQFLSRLHQL